MVHEQPGTAPLQIPTTRVLARRMAPVLAVFGTALAVFAASAANPTGRPYLWLGALGLLGTAAYFGPLRTGLSVDGEARRVTAWWRWLMFGGQRTIDASGKPIVVERTIRRSKESGTTELFRIMLGDCVLHTLSEHQGGAEAAGDIARRVAAHVGSQFAGQRDCAEMIRREALRSRFALAPLLAVLVAMCVGVLVMMFAAR